MLPALKSDGLSLADVMKSCLAAVRHEPNRLDLPPVESAIVVLVDGLGADALAARAGHARTLAGGLSRRAIIQSGFPTTTAAALASLTTGLPPGQHGLVGYTVHDAEHDRTVNQLSGWDDELDPATWQLAPTLFERAIQDGVDAVAIGPGRYSSSGFTAAVLRGARYVPGRTMTDRVDQAVEVVRSPGRHLVYLYIPELDSAAHAYGVASAEWTRALETADSAMRELAASIPPTVGLLVTADHGIVDVPPTSHVLLDDALLESVRFVAGEPRCLQLHLDPGADLEVVAARWREAEASRSWVVTRGEAIDAGWFGPVVPEVIPRIGDLIVAARKSIAYYDARDPEGHGRSMIGQHGSWSPGEVRVPLLRFGAFAF